MGWVRIEPSWRATIHEEGLVSAEDFLRLPGVILCGHPDRHVLRIEAGSLQGCFLKKEHRVPWRNRLESAWAGHGFVSKSTREAETLYQLSQAGIPCPRVLAHGEKGRQAFLLLRDEPGVMDLSHHLRQHPEQAASIADALGRELARMHAAGFEHGDLYTKHILVGPGPRFCFIDWQRARSRRKMSWKRRCRDLATLDATLPEALAANRVRLACLRSYVYATVEQNSSRCSCRGLLRTWSLRIECLSRKLQHKRRIRNLRRLPLPLGEQGLVWLDGEALCVTRAFREEIGGQVPEWLRFRSVEQSAVEEREVKLSGGRAGNLVQRSAHGLGRWLLPWRRRSPAPEVQHAALLFRLERHDVPCPKLLAFGQNRLGRWHQHSFLLTEIPPIEGLLRDLLAQSAPPSERGNWLRQAGALLRGLHESGYVLGRYASELGESCALVRDVPPRLLWTRIDRLERNTRPCRELAILDLRSLRALHKSSATETMSFFLGFLGTRRLTTEGHGLALEILARLPRKVAR